MLPLIDIKSKTLPELTELLSEYSQPKYRAEQVYSHLMRGVTDFDGMSNIPNSLKDILKSNCYIATVTPERRLESKIDGTVKYLYRLYDGEFIESVFMKYHHGYTVCISTQVGCRMGCSFCASGLFGLCRNLTASEMLAQIEYAARDNNVRISNVVMMGMGEPLDNYDNSVRFLHLVGDKKGLGIGMRHISLSTSGVVSGIKRLAKENLPITLSVSLHAPTNEMRSSIMPVNKSYNIESLIAACKEYQRATGRRISFEYALIGGVNDSCECADKLVRLLSGLMCHVNLIPANPVKENDFVKSDIESVKKFTDYINKKGITATVRRTLGADIDASCGQLRRKERGNA